ncbi:MAG: HAMP domain-containing sensor histidine kinase [Candidatus Taylorbacteria bacterium]|nr:HAMP domain-containing sensor histidine kinase [Candidatus Taylorbacteria bacterium]
MTEGVAFTQQILNASNVEKGTTQFMTQSVDMRKVVEDVVPMLKSIAEKKGLEFKMEISEGDYVMTGDEIQLKESVRNIIDNSVHYTPAGTITVSLARKDDRIIFKVQDTGIGMTEADKSKLFTKGGRGKDSLSINVNSTGYGLFFVKKVIEAHGGTVRAESEGKDKGSVFTVELGVGKNI